MGKRKGHGAAALMAAAALIGCAQTPPQTPPAALAEEQARASTLPQQQQPPQQPDAARRNMLVVFMRQAVQRDELIESVSGLPRTATNFAAVKAAMVGIYTDDVVVRWMIEQLDKGMPKERFIGEVGSRFMSGANRLGDTEAMGMLRPMGSMFSRMNAEQCQAFLKSGKQDQGKSAMHAMLVAMNDAEVRQFFDAVRLSLRADIEGRPVRPVPPDDRLAEMLKSLDRATGGAIYAPAGRSDSCQQTVKVVRGIDALQGEQRSTGITFVLAVMGLGARQAAAAR